MWGAVIGDMAGSMAEALYGIDKELIEKARIKLPLDFVNVLDEAYHIKCNEVSR